jgi:hypothetical protein
VIDGEVGSAGWLVDQVADDFVDRFQRVDQRTGDREFTLGGGAIA